MGRGLLILEAEPARGALLAEYCASRGYRPRVAADLGEFTEAWRPGLRMIAISLPLADTAGIEAIRFLARRRCEAGVILTSDADPRILSAASRLARSRGLRVIGTLAQPFSSEALGALLRRPDPELPAESAILQVQLAREDLRDCLGRKLVRTWFQPKINVRNLELAAVEALVRLDHPARGLLRPGAFLAMAEESGLIAELTEAVAIEAFTWGARWYAAGLPIHMAVNISPILLSDLDLPEILDDWLGELRLPAGHVILEVTENWLAVDSVAALDTLTRLRLRGFQLSIDDFGTGFSTMMQLNEIPFGEMKLDQSFVRNATLDREARAIVESSIELGHKLGMRVVAEGIERQADWDLISELGCDEGQGYFLARPMEPDDLPAWLARWNACLGGADIRRDTEIAPSQPAELTAA